MTLDVSPFSPLRSESPHEDRRFALYGISWDTYERLREELGNGLRLTYVRGTLEIMSPSFAHEDVKTLIGRLVEAWGEERGVDLNGYGNVTLKRPEEKALEPDECYCVGRVHETPDLAIEVVLTSGYVDKLEIYQDLGVKELWVYKDGRITVLWLENTGYVKQSGSRVLPALDLDELCQYVKVGGGQTAQVRAYREVLRRQ